MTNTVETPQKWYDKTGLVVLLCLFFFPVGLYALWKSSKIAKGWKVAGTVGIGLMVITAASGKTDAASHPAAPAVTAAVSKPAAPEVSDEKPVAEVTADKDKDKDQEKDKVNGNGYLFESADDFKKAFNEHAVSDHLDLTIDHIAVKDGEVKNVFQYMFTDNLGIIGSVDKSNGKVIEVMLIGTGDGTVRSGADIFIGIAAIISTVDPSLEPAKRGQILKDLGLLGDKKKDISDMEGNTEMNGIKYYVTTSKVTGLMFGASRQ